MRILLISLILVAGYSITLFGQNTKADVIKIGLLISEDPLEDSLSLSAVHGAQLAIKHLNLPIELSVRSCDGPWGVTSKQVVDFIYEDEVDAIITSVDGRNAHLAEQVATKAHISLISARSTDPTLTQAFVPWFFRITPDDRKQADALKEEIFVKRKLKNIEIVHPSEYNGTYSSNYFASILDENQVAGTEPIFYDPLTNNFESLINKIRNHNPDGIVLLGSAKFTSDLVIELADKFPDLPLFGNQAIAASGTQLKIMPDGISIVAPEELSQAFISQFEQEYGYSSGFASSYSYDAMNLVVNAILKVSSDHDLLQEELRMTDFRGVTGIIQFDEHGNRSSKCIIGKIINGNLVLEE